MLIPIGRPVTLPAGPTAVRKTPSYECRLRQLHTEALAAIAAYNSAARHTSAARLRGASLPWELRLACSDSLFPIPSPQGIPVPKQNFTPEPADSLAIEARRLGVPTAEIRRRFNLAANPTDFSKPTKPPARAPKPTKSAFNIALDEILKDLI
jgi:hypothetical protein